MVAIQQRSVGAWFRPVERSYLQSLVHGSVQVETAILQALIQEFPKREGSLSVVVVQPTKLVAGDATGRAIDAPCQDVRGTRAHLARLTKTIFADFG